MFGLTSAGVPAKGGEWVVPPPAFAFVGLIPDEARPAGSGGYGAHAAGSAASGHDQRFHPGLGGRP